MPGNGLAFAVKVSGQVDVIDIFRKPLKLGDYFFLTRQNLVICLPVVLWVDTHASDELRLRFLFLVGNFFLGGHLPGLGGGGGSRLGIDRLATAAGGKITNMTDTGFDHELGSKILVNSPGLRRRLNYY